MPAMTPDGNNAATNPQDERQIERQEREHAAQIHALRYARDHYTPESRIVEVIEAVDQAPTNAPPGSRPPTPHTTLWHALVAMEDGRHAAVDVRYDGGESPQNDADDDSRWSVFEVSPPTLGDLRGG